MEYSKNFDFALPSSNNDADLADINEIANNFRKIDEKVAEKEKVEKLDQTITKEVETLTKEVKTLNRIVTGEISYQIEEGRQLGPNGGTVGNPAWSITELTECLGISKLYIDKNGASGEIRLAFYGEKTNPISFLSNPNGVIDIPEDAKYFRLSAPTENLSKLIVTADSLNEKVDNLIEDVNKIKPDLEYDPESENPQSGIAVAQALSGANGVKYIRETVEAHTLEDGIYIIDGDSGGEVFLNDIAIGNMAGNQSIYYGMVFVTSDTNMGAKQTTLFIRDEVTWLPRILITYVDSYGNYYEDSTALFVDKKYIDEQIAILQAQIDELKSPTDDTPTVRTEIELNNKGDLVYSWDTGSSSGSYTKTNDGWSIIGYEKSGSMSYIALVGKTQESVVTNASSTGSGTLNYNDETYYYSVNDVYTQYVTDYGKAVQLEATYTNKIQLATHLLDYYYGVE